MGDSVSVDLFALTTFAHDMGALADGSMTPASFYGTTISSLAQMIDTETTMASGFSEAQAFARYHQVVAGSMRAFLQDILKGTSSLGAGAEVCAINYADTDQFNAAMLRKLQADMKAGQNAKDPAMFGPMGFTLHGTGQVTTGDINSAFTPKDDRALWQTNPTTGGTGGTTAKVNPLTPEQQKQFDTEFNKKVNENKQLLVNGLPVDDPQSMANKAGDQFTIADKDHPDLNVIVPKDDTDLDKPELPKKPVTG